LELLRIYGKNYVRLSNCLGVISAALQVNDPKIVHRDLVISALGLFDGTKPQLIAAGLTATVAQMARAEEIWNLYHRPDLFSIQCAELLHRLEDELESRILLMIPASVQPLYDTPRTGWEECVDRFPSTVDNVDEMNRCFAFGGYAASVFHSLLIAEAGLIELGTHIGATDPKTGWDATSRRLAELCKAGRSAYTYAVPFNTLEQINQAVQSMKVAWRNKVNHEAGRLIVLDPQFSEQQAQEIVMSTRSFMRWVATALP
jgi:hypothetical protein